MKKTYSLLRFIVPRLALLLTILGTASCASPIPHRPTTTSVVFAASPPNVASSTPVPASPTSSATQMPKPTATRTPLLNSTPRLSRTAQTDEFSTDNKYPRPTKIPTPIAYPTLDSQGRLNFVLQALKTNVDCELPCWWGITPGKTTWDDMSNTFVKQGIGFGNAERNQLYLSLTGNKKYAEQTVDVTFQKENGIVQSINVKADYYSALVGSSYLHVWQKYTLDRILSLLGTPTQIYLEMGVGAADWSPGMQATYDLWLEYTHKGIVFRYPGKLIRNGQGWHVCPAFNNFNGIEIRLQSPKSSTSLSESDLDNLGYSFSGNLKDLTGVTRKEFYEMFKQSPPQGCLLVTNPSPWYDKIALPKPSMILPVPQEEEYLINNLANNADCELPCWWSIKPGETTSQSVQQMFLNLGKSVSRNEDRRGLQYQVSLFGRHSPYPFDYTVEHRWFDENGVVKLFGVTGSALNWSPPQHFTQDWNRYALHEALARYGIPSKVLVHYWDFGWRYDITLVYEDKGFLIRYSGPIGDGKFDSTSDKPLDICLVQNKPIEITIWMTQPASKALANFEYGRWDLSPSESPMPSLEEVTDMTVQKFYETFLNPNTTTCLTVPRNKGEMAP